MNTYGLRGHIYALYTCSGTNSTFGLNAGGNN